MERMTHRYRNGIPYYVVDQRESIIGRLASIEDILGDDYDLDRLRELVEADREGRCVVFTVKQGDKLFYCDDCGVDTEIVEKIVVDIETDGGIYKPEEIGKTVFLSREAAEQALKEGQNGWMD